MSAIAAGYTGAGPQDRQQPCPGSVSDRTRALFAPWARTGGPPSWGGKLSLMHVWQHFLRPQVAPREENWGRPGGEASVNRWVWQRMWSGNHFILNNTFTIYINLQYQIFSLSSYRSQEGICRLQRVVFQSLDVVS